MRAIGMAASDGLLYVLRSDGAVFVLLKRGTLDFDGESVSTPRWTMCPAVPGTEAATEQQG